MSKIFTDQIGNQISQPKFPLKIISLVPSQTELLHDLGLENEVIGITKFCVRPQRWFKEKPFMGGTKTLHLDRIDALQPNLILANKEENTQSQIEELQKNYPVWTSDIQNLEDAILMIREVSKLVKKEKDGEQIIQKINANFEDLQKTIAQKNTAKRKAAYFIWREPMMVAGGDTFINSMLEKAGFENAFKNQNRYPEISFEDLQKAELDYILLSSEPFPFKEKHISGFRRICPFAKVKLVDGEMFSWYGSRLIKAANYFQELLNDEAQT